MLTALEAGQSAPIHETKSNNFFENKSYLLKGTGFDVERQISTLQETIRKETPSRGYDRAVEDALKQVAEDINGFSLEYLEQKPFLPFMYEYQNKDGARRVVAPRYGNKLMTQLSDPLERNGAVSTSMVEIEKELLTLPAGSLVVRTSPPGWSGFPGITYEDTQTQIMQVVEESGNRKVRGHTIRSGMSAAQNAQLLHSLGISRDLVENSFSHEEFLSKISRQYAVIGSDAHRVEIEDIVKLIGSITGDRFHNNTNTSDVLKDLVNFYPLLELDDLSKKYAYEFSAYAASLLDQYRNQIHSCGFLPEELVIELQKALGLTIIRLSQSRRQKTDFTVLEKYEAYSPQTIRSGYSTADIRMLQKELNYLQSLPGCAGGGGGRFSVKTVETPFGPRQIKFDPSKTENNGSVDPSCVTCPKCNHLGVSVDSEGHFVCPECKSVGPKAS